MNAAGITDSVMDVARELQPTGLLVLSFMTFSGAGLCAGSLWWLRKK
jgi:hypothetical protein